MDANKLSNLLGIYGKIPYFGDFINRNLSDRQINWWHKWFTSSFAEFTCHDDKEKYLQAPIWNFILPADLETPFVKIGAMIASFDRVGRKYPFILVLHIPIEEYFSNILFAMEPFYRQTNQFLANISSLSSILKVDQMNDLLKKNLKIIYSNVAKNDIKTINNSREDSDIMDILNLGHVQNIATNTETRIEIKDIFNQFTGDGNTGFWFYYDKNLNLIEDSYMHSGLDNYLFTRLFTNYKLSGIKIGDIFNAT